MALTTVGTQSSVATTISVKPPPLADAAAAEARAVSSLPSPDEGMAEPTSLAGSQASFHYLKVVAKASSLQQPHWTLKKAFSRR